MVFVKVRETYDLKTVRNKMSLIAIHTPDSDIIKKNWPGLIMNTKFYKPVSCDVTVACASTLPLDPQGVGTTEGDVAPEDLFNPILYKACTNESFSLLEARILAEMENVVGTEIQGQMAKVDADDATPYDSDFSVYYGLLSDSHGWRHAMPQQGLMMRGLKPYVHEVLANFASQSHSSDVNSSVRYPAGNGTETGTVAPRFIRGNSKPMPRIPCTSFAVSITPLHPGFDVPVDNAMQVVPTMRTLVGCIIMPPSRLHELFYRMVVEWTLEFTEIRTLSELARYDSLANLGNVTHYQSYDFGESKLVTNEAGLASASCDIDKVM